MCFVSLDDDLNIIKGTKLLATPRDQHSKKNNFSSHMFMIYILTYSNSNCVVA